MNYTIMNYKPALKQVDRARCSQFVVGKGKRMPDGTAKKPQHFAFPGQTRRCEKCSSEGSYASLQ